MGSFGGRPHHPGPAPLIMVNPDCAKSRAVSLASDKVSPGLPRITKNRNSHKVKEIVYLNLARFSRPDSKRNPKKFKIKNQKQNPLNKSKLKIFLTLLAVLTFEFSFALIQYKICSFVSRSCQFVFSNNSSSLFIFSPDICLPNTIPHQKTSAPASRQEEWFSRLGRRQRQFENPNPSFCRQEESSRILKGKRGKFCPPLP